MENKPYLLFRPKSDTKDCVILVLWFTNFDDALYSIQENAEVIKKKLLADVYQLRFKVENIPLPRRFTLYMLNNYTTLAIQNDQQWHLPPQNQKQLESFLTLLKAHNITSTKNHKLFDAALPTRTLNFFKQSLKIWRHICNEKSAFFRLCDYPPAVRIRRLPRSTTKRLDACCPKSPPFPPMNWRLRWTYRTLSRTCA